MKLGSWNTLTIVVAVLALGIGGPWLVREVKSLPRTALAARADQRIVTLEVGGMTCSGCAATIEKRLAAVPGVAAVRVGLKQRRAYVVCEKGVADTALTAVVGRAGPGFLGVVATR